MAVGVGGRGVGEFVVVVVVQVGMGGVRRVMLELLAYAWAHACVWWLASGRAGGAQCVWVLHERRRRDVARLSCLTATSLPLLPPPYLLRVQFKRIDPKNKHMKTAVLGMGGRGRAVATRANKNVGR